MYQLMARAKRPAMRQVSHSADGPAQTEAKPEQSDADADAPVDASRSRRTTRSRRTKAAPKRPEADASEAMPASEPTEEPKRKPRRNTRRVDAEDSADDVESFSKSDAVVAEAKTDVPSDEAPKVEEKKAKSWWQSRFFS